MDCEPTSYSLNQLHVAFLNREDGKALSSSFDSITAKNALVPIYGADGVNATSSVLLDLNLGDTITTFYFYKNTDIDTLIDTLSVSYETTTDVITPNCYFYNRVKSLRISDTTNFDSVSIHQNFIELKSDSVNVKIWL